MTADDYLHELVFIDRTARPATWATRCNRTDVPLERALTPSPTSYYQVTCPDCLAAAGSQPGNPVALLELLGAKVSPALTRSGPLEITARDCVLCGPAQDCRCAEIEFGSAEYFARLDRLHGRAR